MQDRFSSLRRLLFWCALLGVSFLALLPPPHVIHLTPSDKIDHLFAFLVLAALALFAYPRRPAVMLGIGLIAFGGFLELAQAISFVHRDASLNDWLVDIVGACVGIVAVGLFKTFLNGRRDQAA